MSNRWIVSDWHAFHANILKFYPDQPWKTIHERDEALIQLHNERVKPQDRYYMLGDATLLRGNRQNQEKFIQYVKRFNGHGVLFPGNHDHFEAKVYLEAGFEDIRATWRDEQGIIFSHFPLHPRSLGSATANVHGHTHAIPDYDPVLSIDKHGKLHAVPFINVSLERTNYHPISLDEVQQRIRLTKEKWESEVGESNHGS